MSHLNWFWIAIALAVPGVAGGAIAYPVWLKGHPILGNLAGTAIIFGASVGFIMRERIEIDLAAQACLERGFVCFPEPSAFTRFAIYAFIGLIQIMVLFTVSLRVETKIRRRGYAPEWR
ncbi:MAG: hypothetical protein LAO77_10040 [Acidobacteriia bacterium]|nr:hypothetical protein [Terriglobia bacterium]